MKKISCREFLNIPRAQLMILIPRGHLLSRESKNG